MKASAMTAPWEFVAFIAQIRALASGQRQARFGDCVPLAKVGD
jgi:hypothetical protein